MKKFKLIPLILIICLCFGLGAPAAAALEEPEIPAKAAVVIDLKSGNVLYSLNMDEQRAPASLTKVMTALLTLEAIEAGNLSMDTVITAQENCRSGLSDDSSTSWIMPGTQVTVEELMYCIMLQSANEATNILGIHIGGSIEGFVSMMNERAKQLGCQNTNFVTTNGLSAEGHYSSAHDLALITQEAIKHPAFLAFCNTLSYEPSSDGINYGNTMHNSNALLTPHSIYGDDYVYEYASGVKTGYTRASGYCLISTAEKDDISALAVVLGCDGQLNAGIDEFKNFEASITLYNWLFDNFAYRTVLKKTDTVQKIDVQLAKDGVQAALRPQEDIELLLPTDLTDADVVTSVSLIEDKLVAPVTAGTVLGEARIMVDGVVKATVKLECSNNIELSRSEYLKQKLSELMSNGWVVTMLIVVAVLALIYLALVIRYRTLRRKHLQARRRMEERRRLEQERLYQDNYFDEDNSEPTQRFTKEDMRSFVGENDESYERFNLDEFFEDEED